ncbi:effector-associated constant component EACC1 [Actinoplanes sp. CA-131856]
MLIRITSSDDPSLHSLAEWLEADDFEASLGASGARPGAQSPLDVIDVILSNATAIAALLLSYRQWRTAKDRGDGPKITFRQGDVEITAEDADEETIQRVLEALRDGPR